MAVEDVEMPVEIEELYSAFETADKQKSLQFTDFRV